MKKEILEDLIRNGNSTYKIAVILGKVPNTIHYWIKKFELSEFYKSKSKYRRQKLQITDFEEKQLRNIVEKSKTLTECLKSMGISSQGNNYRTLKKRLSSLSIDTSHFKSDDIRISKLNEYTKENRIPLKNILVQKSSYSRSSLKSRLYKEGLKNRECEMCGQGENWNGNKMSLILDHINGIFNDNRIENLRMLCANCNATLSTNGGKNCSKK